MLQIVKIFLLPRISHHIYIIYYMNSYSENVYGLVCLFKINYCKTKVNFNLRMSNCIYILYAEINYYKLYILNYMIINVSLVVK